MKQQDPSVETLMEEIRNLKERLFESEQTVQAIRNGEVDALVINKPGEEAHLYTLTGADHGYRVLVESISEGALLLSSDDSIYYCNRTLCEILQLSAQKIVTRKLDSYVTPEDRSRLLELIKESRSYGAGRGEFLLKRNDGTLLPVNVSLNRLIIEKFEGVCAVITDLSDQKRIEEELRRHRTELESLVKERTADCQREIIERKRAEEDVRSQREWLRVTLSSIGDAVIATDTSARITFINPIAADLTGWREEEARGKLIEDVFKIINAKTEKSASDVVRRVLRDGRTALLSNNTSLITRDGREIPVEDSAAPIRDITGEMLGVVLVFHDVTEKRRAQNALRESAERLKEYEKAVEGVDDMIAVVDRDYRYLIANRAFLDYRNMEREQVVGHPVKEVLEKELFDKVVDKLAECFRGNVVKYEMKYNYPKHGDRDLSITLFPIEGPTGVDRAACVLKDVTELKRAEDETHRLHETIRHERDTLSALVDSMQDEVWFANAQKKFTLTNPMALREFALDSDSDVDVERFAASMEIFRPDGSPRPVEEAPPLRSLKGEVVRNLEEIIRIPASGELRYRQVNSSPVKDPNGRIIGSVSVVRDITKQKKMEEELRRSRDELELRVRERTAELSQAVTKLEEMNQELQEFAFIASHDLQEPLRKIQTFGNMLVRKHKESLNTEGRDYMDRIIKGANRMSVLLRALLSYSRTGTSTLNHRPVSLTEIANDVTSDLEHLIKKNKAKVEISELPTADVAPPLIRQLFQNIIENSIKYRKESEPPIVKIYGTRSDSECQISIEDNGIGFDECYCRQIFKPFERLHGKDSPYSGTGMGLAICKKIVARHGGDITASSIPGQGTTFIVTLPLEQKTGA